MSCLLCFVMNVMYWRCRVATLWQRRGTPGRSRPVPRAARRHRCRCRRRTSSTPSSSTVVLHTLPTGLPRGGVQPWRSLSRPAAAPTAGTGTRRHRGKSSGRCLYVIVKNEQEIQLSLIDRAENHNNWRQSP